MNILCSIEINEKKEELRQMVGRRYRDLLEASSALRRVSQNSADFSLKVNEVRTLGLEKILRKKPTMPCHILYMISALHKFHSVIGQFDPVANAFLMLTAEVIHRDLCADSFQCEASKIFVNYISPKLFRMRLHLEEDLKNKIGFSTEMDELTSVLVAVIILSNVPLETLIDMVFERKLAKLRQYCLTSPSIISSTWDIRSTFQSLKEIFMDGAILQRIESVSNDKWIPDAINYVLNDEPLMLAKIVQASCCMVNVQCRTINIGGLAKNTFSEKCGSFIDRISEVYNSLIQQKLEHFETSQSLIECVKVLMEAFNDDWPYAGNGVEIFRRLFDNSIINKLRELMDSELLEIGNFVLEGVGAITCDPSPMFSKRRVKIHLFHSIDFSEDLIEFVEKFNSRIKSVYGTIKEYERIGKEECADTLSTHFSHSLVGLIKRICRKCDEQVSLGVDIHLEAIAPAPCNRILSLARLCIAIIKSDSIISECLSANAEQITECSSTLVKSAENLLCKYMEMLVDECVVESDLKLIATVCFDPIDFIPSIQEFEKLTMADIGVVEVPMQINRCLYGFLFKICLKISYLSLGHLCTRNVRLCLSSKIGSVLSDLYSQVSSSDVQLIPRIALQYFFDIRVLDTMLSCDSLRPLKPLFAAKLDPFDLSLLSSPITRNSRTASQRYSIMFGVILPGFIPSKDINQHPSYTEIVDLLPRIADVSRFVLFPRIRINPQTSAKASTADNSSHVKETSSTNTTLSSFYKIPSWFGNYSD